MASYQYTPYGEFLSESTTGDHATFGFTGHRLDRELDHYYAKYRYYNPTTMRWLKRDPLGMVDGPNVYAYVRGNVVNAVDPSGLYGLGGYPAPGEGYFKRKESCHCAAKRIAKEAGHKYPHPEEDNHIRHCYASCKLAAEKDVSCSFIMGWGREFRGEFEWRDIESNRIGRRCSRTARNNPAVNVDAACRNCCQNNPPSYH